MMGVSRHPEKGAVAVVVAISATMIFALCALGVDLGAAYARKRDIQTQADLAALAAAAYLPYSPATQAQIADTANGYVTNNEVLGQKSSDWNFTDADKMNGYIEFVGTDKLRLVSPKSRVNFALAPAAGLPSGMDVSASAAAEIKSPGVALPFFISLSCASGLQTILDQTSGKTIDSAYVPTLSPEGALNHNYDVDALDVTSVPLYAAPTSLTVTFKTSITGDIDKVGFTSEAEGVLPARHEEALVTGASGGSAVVDVPPAVLAGGEAVWWVRLHKASGGWTRAEGAKHFVVGDGVSVPTGSCASKNEGNFGSLKLPRDDVTAGQELTENLALGIQHDLDAFPPPATGSYPLACAGQPHAVQPADPPSDSVDPNCLDTDTGADLKNKATEAFIKGTASGSPARLDGDDHPTATDCDPSGGASERTVETTGNPSSFVINDDVLSCFITDGAVTVGEVSSATYSGPAGVISPTIFSSPRFFWLPVLATDPSSGGSGTYAVVTMRPAFITGQSEDATLTSPLPALNPENGIVMANKSISKVTVRVINPIALPATTVVDGPVIDYVGTGTRIIRLVE
jgi:hypothetical protein